MGTDSQLYAAHSEGPWEIDEWVSPSRMRGSIYLLMDRADSSRHTTRLVP
jgi:hypothetical protein